MLAFDKMISAEGAYKTLLQRIQELEVKLRDAGLRVLGSSRLGNYRRILDKAMRVVGPAESAIDFRVLHQAILECNQLLLIVEELERNPEVPGWRPKVQELLSGHDLPEAKDVRSPGRNTQFELYIAGICRRAGYSIALGEPDLIIEASDVRLGLATKRLKSLSKLKGNLKDASTQLKLTGLSGFIALDLSLPLVSLDDPWIARNREEAKEICSATLGDFIRDNRFRIRNSVDYSYAFSLLGFLTAPVIFSDRGILASVTACRAVNLCSDQDLRCREIASFVQRVARIELD